MRQRDGGLALLALLVAACQPAPTSAAPATTAPTASATAPVASATSLPSLTSALTVAPREAKCNEPIT